MKKSPAQQYFWKKLSFTATCLSALLLISGCASTEITDRKRLVTEKLQRPGKILIHDFVVNKADVPQDSALTGKTDGKVTPPTKEDIKVGRKLGAEMASQLVKQINAMGITAVKAKSATKPQINDIVLRGYILSVVQGQGAKRVVIGFGYGASELQTFVEGYQMTAKGLRKLGSGKVKAGGNKTPGGALGALSFIARANPIGLIVGVGVKSYGEISGSSKVEGLAKDSAKKIAEELKIKFKKEGWVK
jgi:Domain of unknown function (DUF4410)